MKIKNKIKKQIEEELKCLIKELKCFIPKEDYFLFRGRIGKLIDKTKEQAEKELEGKLRANIIRELKKNHPKGFCYICGKGKKTTIHHLRDMNSRGKGKIKGVIPLCRDCHDSIEQMKKFKKLKESYKKGSEQAQKDIIEKIGKIKLKLADKFNKIKEKNKKEQYLCSGAYQILDELIKLIGENGK